MARKQQKIKVISYCYVGDQLTPVDDLNAEQKERLAIGLQWGLLTSTFGSQAKFYAPGYDICRDQHGRIKVTRVPAGT